MSVSVWNTTQNCFFSFKQILSASASRVRITFHGSLKRCIEIYHLIPQSPSISPFHAGKKEHKQKQIRAINRSPSLFMPDRDKKRMTKKKKKQTSGQTNERGVHTFCCYKPVQSNFTDSHIMMAKCKINLQYLFLYPLSFSRAGEFLFRQPSDTREPSRWNRRHGITSKPHWPPAASFSSRSYSIE